MKWSRAVAQVSCRDCPDIQRWCLMSSQSIIVLRVLVYSLKCTNCFAVATAATDIDAINSTHACTLTSCICTLGEMPQTRSQARMNNKSSPLDDRITSTLLTLSTLYETHIQPQLPEALQPISSQAVNLVFTSAPYVSQALGVAQYISSYISSLSFNAGLGNGASLLSLGLLLITLYMGLRIANYVRRTIFSWIWLGAKLLLLLVCVQIGFYVSTHGLDNTVRQAGWVGGIVWGLLEDMVNGNSQQAYGQQQQQRTTPRGMRSRAQARADRQYDGYGDGGARWF